MKAHFLKLCIFLSLGSSSLGHVVDQIYGTFSVLETGEWEIRYVLDIAYAEGDWEDVESPQKPRSYLFGLKEDEMELLKQQALEVFTKSVMIEPGGFELSLPDFAVDPPSFPKLLTGGAYLTVLMTGNIPSKGRLLYQLNPTVETSFVIGKGVGCEDEAYFTLWGGHEGLELLNAEEVSVIRLTDSLSKEVSQVDRGELPLWALSGGVFLLIALGVYRIQK